jgi:hypothetical protein
MNLLTSSRLPATTTDRDDRPDRTSRLGNNNIGIKLNLLQKVILSELLYTSWRDPFNRLEIAFS